MTTFYIILGVFGIFILYMILSEVPTHKPRLRIVETYQYPRVFYRVERRSIVGEWYTLQVPMDMQQMIIKPYSLIDPLGYNCDNAFDTVEEAKDWLYWYVENRCEEYYKKPKEKIKIPKDQVIFKYKSK